MLIDQIFGEQPESNPGARLAPQHLLESLLFVAAEPLSVSELARAAELPGDTVERALELLEQEYRQRGIRLQRHGDKLQLVSAAEAAPAIARLLNTASSSRLSSAALEVLAIIAYRQPITRTQIEALRGVDSSGVVRALLARDLIMEQGRQESVGRPILYGTTAEFLRAFGLSSLSELPALDLPLP